MCKPKSQDIPAPDLCGQETKHVKVGHVKIDRAHFRVHFREHWEISREHSRGSLRGTHCCVLNRKKKNLNFRGHFRGHLRWHQHCACTEASPRATTGLP